MQVMNPLSITCHFDIYSLKCPSIHLPRFLLVSAAFTYLVYCEKTSLHQRLNQNVALLDATESRDARTVDGQKSVRLLKADSADEKDDDEASKQERSYFWSNLRASKKRESFKELIEALSVAGTNVKIAAELTKTEEVAKKLKEAETEELKKLVESAVANPLTQSSTNGLHRN
ncbi:unnamed protein product [Peronospora belbahrii]|uniref:RxLR effector protein n=1 Tax=Peronospora belbahrii TaxID=622444 RepID=A0ABN8CNK2_9STRA|nr:unnamed protein product [Peronospora belbahrii]